MSSMYKGQVISNFDPSELGRLLVSVPPLTSPNKAMWVEACLPARTFQLPAVGEWVWVMPIQPDGKQAVWMGYAATNCVDNYVGNIAERNGTAVKKQYKQMIKGDPRVSVVDAVRTAEEIKANPRPSTMPDRHTVLKTPGGITIFADDNVLNERYDESLDSLTKLKKKMHQLLTKDDSFHWGIEDPLGNKIVVEHLDGNTFLTLAIEEDNPEKKMVFCFNGFTKEFSIVGKDFEISHNSESKEMFLRDINKNLVEMNKDGIRLTPKDGSGNFTLACANADGDEEPTVLGTQLKAILDALYDAVFTASTAPSPIAYAGALQGAMTQFITAYASYKNGAKSYLTAEE